jgi:hypothetical protein
MRNFRLIDEGHVTKVWNLVPKSHPVFRMIYKTKKSSLIDDF